ncbi:DUF4097 family beta strand repeat-containing protein [Kitasatospora viridis]|uniref:Putative adhesin n=1 Tax=Kitasatospora viridis TaxID=281105 RepID=A0A561UIV0_9ACTN|nr:DUF4097 family beta strand repeat-containing protein [Kitasatospora viridis]TWF99303.1 putative adhesin [Kitasatospora viridis]
MQKFATTSPVTAVLEVTAGRVQLIAADRNDAVVEVRPANPAKSRDVKAAGQFEVSFADGVLRVHNPQARNQYFGPSGSVEITVQLPSGSGVQGKSAACELRGVGRLGDVVFDGAYHRIKLDEAASLRLTATDGDVEVGRVGGPARITTARGDIRIVEAVRGDFELRTHAGDITVGAATGVSASLDAKTGYGRISNALKNDGTPELTIRATVSAGDITAHSR